MKVFEQINRLKQIHKMIKGEVTGSPDIFASCLSISKRQLYNILDEIRLMGAPVEYDKLRCTYYYRYAYEIKMEILFRSLSDEEINTTCGGYFFECNFISLVSDNFVAS